jgi:phospholipid/cholesterol/gamma-HCH transport system substrate-binding protein
MRRGIATKQVKLGIFMVVGMMLFIGCLYYMGSVRHMFQGTFRISAIFKNAKGLQAGNNVTFSGINVGTVDEIQIISDSTVRVFFVVEKQTQKFIRRDAIAKISNEGLMGNKSISIEGGTPGSPMAAEGDVIIANEGIAWDQVVKRFEGAGKNTEDITRDLASIVGDVNDGKGTMGALLKDTVFARQFRDAIMNLQSGTQEFNRILGKVRGEMVDNLAATSKNAAAISSNLNIITLTTKDSILRDLQNVTAKLQSNQGTVGMLLNDTAFAVNVAETVRKVNSGVDQVNDVMAAAKGSFLLKGYFKKKARTEEKIADEKTLDKKSAPTGALVFPE